eukprot:UN15158
MHNGTIQRNRCIHINERDRIKIDPEYGPNNSYHEERCRTINSLKTLHLPGLHEYLHERHKTIKKNRTKKKRILQ